jgi:hypothetical protein
MGAGPQKTGYERAALVGGIKNPLRFEKVEDELADVERMAGQVLLAIVVSTYY